MEQFDRKKHWEEIYTTKELHEVSWYQPTPQTSLDFISMFDLPKFAKIIDVGGGDSFLVDHLLDLGFENVTVLDISEKAIDRAKKRLGERAEKVKWIVADAANFTPTETYDFWHDRAAFHFLTDEKDIKTYVETAHKALEKNGVLAIGTFSEQGPKKCSGIEITQYSKEGLTEIFGDLFTRVACLQVDHKTPFDTVQNFTFCTFRKA